MSHHVTDDSSTALAPPFTCHGCGDNVYAVVEVERNDEQYSALCFDCVRDMAKDVEEHVAEHGRPRT